jgi:diketogulonate reductase-like aldo/keto reductase
MGDRRETRSGEVAALSLGLDLGLSLIDTAEMYGDGEAEAIVGDAIAKRRDEVFLVDKVLPDRASYEGTLRAAESSLRRLRTDRIDLYLLHWRGRHPLADTYRAFERLRTEGKILHFGVSNFDLDDIEESERAPGGRGVAANQILYNLVRRGPERRLLPVCRERSIVAMAYSPLEQARLSFGGALAVVARRHGRTPSQIAIAWTLRDPGVTAIVKATDPEHVRENAAAHEIRLEVEDLAELDRAFPRPESDVPLECL